MSPGSDHSPTGDDVLTQDRVIAHALIDDIVEWRIKPGAWIREREIAVRFGVSHAPVREAFRHVANIGLVNVVPWRGARVIMIDRRATIEVLELWKATFGVVCRLAAVAMTESEGQHLLRRLEEFKDVAARTRNTFDHLAVSNRIGSYIARRSGAPLATELLDRIAILARWQHQVISEKFIESLPVAPALRSAEIYEELCHHIVNRRAAAADEAARALLGHLQDYYSGALDLYFATQEAPVKPRRARRKASGSQQGGAGQDAS
ncbi:MAG: GntR family transcriptional regulator [Hyphomonadaceae bacterium]|nr:GntR family transcriptional regulator [Hyphomonadaceae bacterium]